MNEPPTPITRRRLLQTGAAAVLTGAAAGTVRAAQTEPPPKGHAPMTFTDDQKRRLLRALEPLDRQYDARERMLQRPFSSPGYHTTLTGGMVHPTRESATYAVALLDTGDAEREKRAEDILRRIVTLQDRDPERKTYGIWSWFLEEPLDKMSPPDWNWADFLGVQLLQVALDHRARLPEDLAKDVDAAVAHAARAIRQRNVGPGYTNIAIMGTYVTLVAAETYEDADLKAYALDRLRRFHAYSREQGAFTEYNSPTYTIVALKELGRLRQHARTPEARPLVDDLYRMAWDEIAQHFHAPTRQWAGPHSRAYNTLLDRSALAVIERSTSDKVRFGTDTSRPAADEHRPPTPCPPDLEPFFVSLEAPRTLVKTFVKNEPAIVGTTHLAPAFALGSINRGDLWNQRRPLVCYFGTAAKPSYLRLRFLHDDYDFAAVRYWGQQKDGRVLAALNVATDGGDRHPSLDRIQNGAITARDLRVRFELGGDAANAANAAPPQLPGNANEPIHLHFGDTHIAVLVPYARFGDTTGRWAFSKDDKTAFVEQILYQGDPRPFALHDLDAAAVGIALQVATTTDAPLPQLRLSSNDGRLKLAWDDMAVDVPLRPDTTGALAKSVVLGG